MTDKGPFEYSLQSRDAGSAARTGQVRTPHGSFATPAFMPVGTQATVKGLLPAQVRDTGAEIILANTYHLRLRPGHELVEEMGGLQKFMNWDGPILTDSGGYQVFSLAHRRKITEEGVTFKSHIDGSKLFLGPEEAMRIQLALGSDIIMSFDECIPYPVERRYAEESVARTTRWEKQTLEYHPHDGRALFGIVQGGIWPDLRIRSAHDLLALPFDGYAMGGLFVGENREIAMELLEVVAAEIPEDRARYVMGVGTPLELLDCILRGWDMFDCVLPTRNARHGQAFTRDGVIKLKNAVHRNAPQTIEPDCSCLACSDYSRSYLRHLLMAKELLAATLISHHNLSFMQRLMAEVREAIVEDRLGSFRDDFAARFCSK